MNLRTLFTLNVSYKKKTAFLLHEVLRIVTVVERQKVELWLPGAGDSGDGRRYWFDGYIVSLCKMKRVLCVDVGIGCTAQLMCLTPSSVEHLKWLRW